MDQFEELKSQINRIESKIDWFLSLMSTETNVLGIIRDMKFHRTLCKERTVILRRQNQLDDPSVNMRCLCGSEAIDYVMQMPWFNENR